MKSICVFIFLLNFIINNKFIAQDTLNVKGVISQVDSINTNHGGFLLLITVDTCNCLQDFLVVRSDYVPISPWQLKNYRILVNKICPTDSMIKMGKLLNNCCPPIEQNNMREHPKRIYKLIE
jgi:hypothetical protein